MTLIETLEVITAARLRADAAAAWADAHLSWRERNLGVFYSSVDHAEVGVLLIVTELSRRYLEVSELSRDDVASIVDLEKSVASLIERIIELVASHQFPQIGEPLYRGSKISTKEPAPHNIATKAIGNEQNDPGYTAVRVFYGTDRSGKSDDLRGHSYSHERSRDGVVDFGECLVTVPKRHRVGKLESPSILHFEFKSDPAKHIVLHSVLRKSETDFLQSVAAAVVNSPEREAFIFVHGYNVSFETAARRTAQIAFDLKFAGAAIFYSWPSNASVQAYTIDEANAIWTVPHFVRFLSLISQHCGAARLHVIAHSMGNRAVCDALNDIAARTQDEHRPKLQELILAAPDIDADTFRQMSEAIKSRAERITLYASSKDKALGLSCKIHGYSRAGIPIVIVKGVDSVDASAVNTDFLAHSYFCEDRSVLSDIYSLIRKNENRFDLVEVPGPAGRYYMFRG